MRTECSFPPTPAQRLYAACVPGKGTKLLHTLLGVLRPFELDSQGRVFLSLLRLLLGLLPLALTFTSTGTRTHEKVFLLEHRKREHKSQACSSSFRGRAALTGPFEEGLHVLQAVQAGRANSTLQDVCQATAAAAAARHARQEVQGKGRVNLSFQLCLVGLARLLQPRLFCYTPELAILQGVWGKLVSLSWAGCQNPCNLLPAMDACEANMKLLLPKIQENETQQA